MARSPHRLGLNRQCLGLVTRIECSIRPLAGESRLWMLMSAAGMAGEQPTAVKAQGPFNGPHMAQAILASIIDSLTLHGYEIDEQGPLIWGLHVQAQMRRLNSEPRVFGNLLLQPER